MWGDSYPFLSPVLLPAEVLVGAFLCLSLVVLPFRGCCVPWSLTALSLYVPKHLITCFYPRAIFSPSLFA